MPFSIGIHAIRVKIPIGWSDAERATPQPIRIDLEISKRTPPRATITDELADTIDYHAVAIAVARTASTGSYRLLERFGQAILEEVRLLVPSDSRLSVTITKEQPPIPGVGSTSITLVDPIETA